MGVHSYSCSTSHHSGPGTVREGERMISGNIKSLLRRLTNYRRVEENQPSSTPSTTSISIHSTPAGCYPENGPQPSKLGVLFYILSILFSVIGIISLTKFPLVTEGPEREQILILSFSLVAAGMFFLMITNYIVNKENRAFVVYLNLKVESTWPSTGEISSQSHLMTMRRSKAVREITPNNLI